MTISRIQPILKNECGDEGLADGSNVKEQEASGENSGAAADADALEPRDKESNIKDGVAVVSIVVLQNEACNQVLDLEASNGNVVDFSNDEKVEVVVGDAGHKKDCLQRMESYHEQCR